MALPEILAPAGSFEALSAAVRCGADAVYIGGKNYSARQSAANFDTDEMKKAAELCHLHGVKLYLTVNTILLDEEIKGFAEYIEAAAKAGIDACIVQDLGTAEIIRRVVPGMPLHASTQMTVHTPEGALWAKEHGFKRVVVARELSRQEILPILKCGIEIEQFVHGALCISLSGQCCLSALIGSRSANRGRCAQACRLPFSASGKAGVCSLSLKDLSLISHINELKEDGVASLKIEGRMKRPEYVAAAVTALKQAVNGEEPDTESLRAVFSRSGFTDGYYTGKRQDLFGVREKEDVTAAAAVLPKLQELYRKQPHPVGISISASFFADEPFTLSAEDREGNKAMVQGDIPMKALNRPSDSEQLRKQLSKLGDTVYNLTEFNAECDGISMLPASSVNALRRELTAKLDRERILKNTPVYDTFSADFSEIGGKRRSEHKPWLRFRVRTEGQLRAIEMKNGEECVIPFELTEKVPFRENLILQAPVFVPDEKSFTKKLALLFEKGYRRLVCENPAHIRIGKRLGFELSGGMALHTSNTIAARFFENEGIKDILLSPELTIRQAGRINSGIPVGIYSYGKIPAMIMRACPVKNETGCKNCKGYLTDRTRRKFPVICTKDYSVLLNSVPVWAADKMDELSCCDFLFIDFTDEKEAAEIKRIADAYRYGNEYRPAEFTRGLLYRGIERIS